MAKTVKGPAKGGSSPFAQKLAKSVKTGGAGGGRATVKGVGRAGNSGG